MKKYCHKTSVESVAAEIKTRAGIAQATALAFSNFVSTIRGLVIPVDRGAPNVYLTAASPSYSILRGKYSGGSVSVTAQSYTATLSRDGGYVPMTNLGSSVTVPAKNTYNYAAGLITPTDNSTSMTISGLSFSPVGFVIMCTSPNSKLNGYDDTVATICCIKNGNSYDVNGFMSNRSAYLGLVTGASASFGSNSFSVSNMVGTRNGTSYNLRFRDREFSWFAWG